MNIGVVHSQPVANVVDGNAAAEIPVPRNDDGGRFTNVIYSERRHVTAPTFHTPVPFGICNLVAFNKHCLNLNVDQKEIATFLRNYNSSSADPHLLLISGAPGTGKTYTVLQSLEHFEGLVCKLAYTNQVARSIGGSTIHSQLRINYESREPHSMASIAGRMLQNELILENLTDYVLECHRAADELVENIYPPLSSRPVAVVIDEIGLLPFWFALSIVKYYSPCLFIFIGDEYQLKPVGCSFNVFSVPLSIPTTVIKLDLNNRFSPEYHKLIEEMRVFVTDLNYEGMTVFLKTHFPVRNRILEKDLDQISLVLAYKNETVKEFNAKFLNRIPGELIRIPVKKGQETFQHNAITLKRGCRVVATRETFSMSQGEEGYFSAYSPEANTIELFNGKILRRDTHTGQFPIVPAYSFTIHKYQGQTINQSGILFHFGGGGGGNLNLVYTALSRVRSMQQIYALVL